ncbi:DMT family transporter [Methylobrevis pamukkalensis]|uniref:EamA-like transporter family protein n=1 Tax=Methylobrevis pamukkalensis TaxID=1439726 RepID=A0A1E3H483_9HYPH|nr:DMT family transporter [Methylobrevis pamukkalensis]ODN71114.1 EamA-like transporter family protein [Methylobrevis pamukkalensis]
MSRSVSPGSAAARWLEPLSLLAAAGIGIGSIFPVAKLAGLAGLPPLAFAGGIALVAALVLRLAGRLSGGGGTPVPPKVAWTYAAVAGPLTFAPFGLVAIAVPHVGAGVQALLQSLVPAITVAMAMAIGYERPGRRRAAGLALGFVGAVLIVASRFSGFDAPPAVWMAVSLAVPVILAAGNVFRSLRWPAGAGVLEMATPTLLAAAVLLLAGEGLLELTGLSLATGAFDPVVAAGLVLGQGILTGGGYICFFRLQQVGGPIFLSQISYVNAAVGMGIAVLLLGEHLELGTLAGALVIVVSLFIVGKPAPR